MYSTNLVNVSDLTQKQIDHMCLTKRSIERQSQQSQPSQPSRQSRETLKARDPRRVFIKDQIGGDTLEIPLEVQRAAKEGLKLINMGFSGGTQTGWNRAKQLSGKKIDLESLADMRTWFARHGPDASNGGTSYNGYRRWVDMGKPTNVNKNSIRGAIAWLIWGGDPAYKWLKSSNIQKLLSESFPERSQADSVNRLKGS
jgi:hypothetical protein